MDQSTTLTAVATVTTPVRPVPTLLQLAANTQQVQISLQWPHITTVLPQELIEYCTCHTPADAIRLDRHTEYLPLLLLDITQCPHLANLQLGSQMTPQSQAAISHVARTYFQGLTRDNCNILHVLNSYTFRRSVKSSTAAATTTATPTPSTPSAATTRTLQHDNAVAATTTSVTNNTAEVGQLICLSDNCRIVILLAMFDIDGMSDVHIQYLVSVFRRWILSFGRVDKLGDYIYLMLTLAKRLIQQQRTDVLSVLGQNKGASKMLRAAAGILESTRQLRAADIEAVIELFSQ